MNRILLSIVIPCYNTAHFIVQTIEMLLHQDLSNCELILVNDGSTDDTLSILQKYVSQPNIIVINQPNQGVSVARNVGLAQASGKYVYFLDSDDTLTEGSLNHYKQTLAAHPDCQLYAFGYETRHNGTLGKKYVFPHLDDKEIYGHILTQNFLSKKFCIHICSSIYERQFLIDNQLCFQVGVTIGEDVHFLLQAMFQTGKAYYSQRICFVYQIRDDSVMQGYKSYSLKQYYSHTLLREYLLPIANKDGSMRNYINFFLLFSYLSNLRYYIKSNVRSKEINRKFIKDGSIRYKRCWGNSFFLWLLMKTTIFFPLRVSLYLLKH